MRIEEIDRRWGATSSKWVWSTGPEHAFEPDGTDRLALDPVDTVLPEHYEDEQGWWTCHKDTRMHDLAVIYRSGARNETDGLPRRGPKNLCQVVLATSKAFPLSDDPLAGKFSKYHGCLYVSVGRIEPPVGVAELRSDLATSTWPALRAGFVQAAMPMPPAAWQRLVALAGRASESTPRARLPSPGERRRIEHALEDWLEQNPEQVEKLVGFPCEIAGRQIPCAGGHGGIMDLLVRRSDAKGHFAVLELKADNIRRDAIAQALGYVGWLRAQRRVRHATSVVVGLNVHSQVPWVLSTVGDAVSVRQWKDLDLPAELRALLGSIER